MSRSKHTDPRLILATRRIQAPLESRSTGDLRRRRAWVVQVSSLFLVQSTMPNALRIFIHLPHAVEGHPVNLPLGIGELKGLRAFRRKTHVSEWDQNDAVFRSVVIPHLKAPFGKLRVPPDPVEQFVNGNHPITEILTSWPILK